MGFRSLLRSIALCSVTTDQETVVCDKCTSGSPLPSYVPYHERIVLVDQSIDDLPDDILHLVIQVMFHDDNLTSIKQFSLVSKRIRAISLPYQFREHCWRPGLLCGLLPSKFWDYIRVFHLILDGRMYDPRITSDSGVLSAALPKMANLTRFKLTGTPDHRWRALLPAVAFIPQLSSLEFVCSFWSLAPMSSPKQFIRPPTRLVLHFHRDWQDAMLRGPEPLSDLVFLCSTSLEYLELCGHSLQLDVLKAQVWPCLREFVVCGHSLTPGTSITRILALMPRLWRLDLGFRCKPESGNLVLWSPPPDEGSTNRMLSELTTLAIANPSTFDDSFSYLPPSLQSLSILASAPPLRPLDRDELFQMLRGIPATALTTLRFVIEGPLNDSLFSFINSTFPQLEVLGIHRFTRDRTITEKADEVAAKLQCFKRLKLLQLNIGLHADPYIGDRLNTAPQLWADKIACNVPWIKQIAFSTPLTFFNQYWLTFAIGPPVCSHVEKHGKRATYSIVPGYIKLPC